VDNKKFVIVSEVFQIFFNSVSSIFKNFQVSSIVQLFLLHAGAKAKDLSDDETI